MKATAFSRFKEQALISSTSKKMKQMTENNKMAEEKLWQSYKESEARERALRKQAYKLQKVKGKLFEFRYMLAIQPN